MQLNSPTFLRLHKHGRKWDRNSRLGNGCCDSRCRLWNTSQLLGEIRSDLRKMHRVLITVDSLLPPHV